MKGIVKNIDQILVFSEGNRRLVKVRGWAFTKEQHKCRVVLAEKDFMEQPVIREENRIDVLKGYPQCGDMVECGFLCDISYSFPEAQRERVELYLEDLETQEKERIYALDVAGLEKHRITGQVKYHIDRVEYMLGKMLVTGWAYTSQQMGICECPSLRVTDRNGREIQGRLTQVHRVDVNANTCYAKIEGELGFRLEWTALENESYRLILGKGSGEKQLTLGSEGVKKLSYYGKKVVKRGMDGVKRVLKIGHNSYGAWEKAHRVTEEAFISQRTEQFPIMPKISVVVPAYRTPEKFLREMIDSLLEQSYGNWELCIGDGSMDESICHILAEYAERDGRVRYAVLEQNYGISGNTNKALELATGDYISLLDHDDVLTRDALYEVVKSINETGADVLYTDEDKVTMDLREYFEPHFKPDFNLDLLRSCNYICHFFVVKREIWKEAGLFREECNGSQDFDFILRCTALAKQVSHIPKILYHWRCHPNSTAGDPQSKMYCYEAGKRSLDLYFAENHIRDVEVSIDAHFGYYRARYSAKGAGKTAIIVLPFGGQENMDETLASIRQYTEEGTYIVCQAAAGLSPAEALNQAAEQAEAEYLVFLRAGMTVIQEEWLETLLGNCLRPEVGAIGAPLLVRGKYVVHSGKILGMGGAICRDMFENNMANDVGYAGRMLSQQNVSAISWMGMMVSLENFQKAKGFDEKLKESYLGLDLCLRLRGQGKLVVYTPYTGYALKHYAAKKEKQECDEDTAYIREKWASVLEQPDPYYNINFDRNGESFSLPF